MSAVVEVTAHWTRRALCLGSTANFFTDDPVEVEKAKAVCAGCPVRAECLEYGRHEPDGIWGGLTPQERHVTHPREHSCLSCGGVLIPINRTQERCLGCDFVWFAPA